MATTSNDAVFFFFFVLPENRMRNQEIIWTGTRRPNTYTTKKIKEIIRISGYNTRTLTLHRELPKEAELSSTNFYSKPLA